MASLGLLLNMNLSLFEKTGILTSRESNGTSPDRFELGYSPWRVKERSPSFTTITTLFVPRQTLLSSLILHAPKEN